MKHVAVIMSVYYNDTLKYVKEAIESIVSQNVPFDFYIQEDGKVAPDVDSFLREFEVRENNVSIFRRDINQGLAHSLNEVLDLVLSKNYTFIARMDADDISMPNRFKKQIEYLNVHPETDVIGSWAIEIKENGSEFFRKKMPVTHNECKKLFAKRDCIIHPSAMFRVSYFEKAGNYPIDTFFAEDTILWLKGFESGCIFGNIPEYLFKFRMDNRFFERRRGLKHAQSILRLRLEITSRLGYGLKGYAYAYLYALAKLMPKQLLEIIYKVAR